MNKIINSVLIVGSLALLGGACDKTADTNVNGNTNVSINTNAEVNNNSEVNTNSFPTANWQTYTNDEYGFSFRYPEDWILEESNRNSCVGLLTKERHIERIQVLDQIKKDDGGTDAVPGNYITVCLREENVTTDVITWGESNVKKYVDEAYRGESELNTLTAYLVIDLDFGESNNYYLKSDDGSVYSVYYTVEKSEIDDEIIKIVKSLKF